MIKGKINRNDTPKLKQQQKEESTKERREEEPRKSLPSGSHPEPASALCLFLNSFMFI